MSFCHLHWQRQHRTGLVELVVRQVQLCAVDNCIIKQYCKGFCNKHYNRYRKHGNPLIVLPRVNRNYQTQEVRKKISLATKGRKKSLEMRQKLSLAKRGVNSLHLWKGGITKKNQLIRSSSEYRLWRTSVFERDDYTCQICQQRGGRLNADHIKQFALFPELRLDLTNGRTLCEPCHRKTDTYGKSPYRKHSKKNQIIYMKEARS
jgi:HNH endonuclease/NUMOD3 motif-containing protein